MSIWLFKTYTCRMAVLNRLQGILFAILLFLGSFLGLPFLSGIYAVFILFRPSFYRRLLDEMVGAWQYFTAALLEKLLGMKVVITGDEIRPAERSLLIMNHRTRLDWMYLWSLLVRQSGVKTEKIILKSQLKHIPGAGWAMQVGTFLFIQRKWEQDKIVLTKMLDYFADIQHKTQVLLFPEGTDLTPSSKASSDRFAKKQGWPLYEYVLHPRTTGFNYIVQQMRQNEALDAIYDITVGYPCNIPQNESSLGKGEAPQEVHFHVKRYPVQTLPLSEDGLSEWCHKRWEEKEKKLAKFYAQSHFQEENNTEKTSRQNVLDINFTLWMAIAYWMAFIVVMIAFLYLTSIARYYLLLHVIWFVFVEFRGGMDLMLVDLFHRLHNHRTRVYN